MDRDNLTAVGWPHAASSAATQWTHAAGASLAIVMLGARLVSFLVSFLEPNHPPESRSDGLLPPAARPPMGRDGYPLAA